MSGYLIDFSLDKFGISISLYVLKILVEELKGLYN